MTTTTQVHNGEGLGFLLVNFERSWRQLDEIIGWMGDDAAVIVDEGHRIASHKSRQSKAAALIGANARYRLDLTGTPTDGDEIDLWAQFRFIKPELLGADWKDFEKKWLRKSGFKRYEQKVKKHLVKKLYGILGLWTVSITREEAGLAGQEEDYEILFDLTGKAKRAYRELEEQLYTEIKEDDVMLATPQRVTQMIKLQQITGGFLQTEDALVHLEQDKLANLVDWLEDFRDRKIVIFARFVPEVLAIEAVLKRKEWAVGILYGKTKDRTIWETFQDKKKPQVLVIQSQTGGEAIDCSVGDIGVFYSKTWSWRNYDQCRARLLGTKKLTMFAHMIANNSIDMDNQAVISKKGMKSRDVLRQLKSRRGSDG